LEGGAGCCGDLEICEPISEALYTADDAGQVPEAAVKASLGCGNPTALIELRDGDVVLDLGSGGGVDVLLSARRVGPTGKVYGLDMTDEMLELARKNQRAAGVDNVEFLKGEIEDIPLPDSSVDVIISNCVINLSADKTRVLAEAFRVLRPGGRFAISDVVARQVMDESVRENAALWSACLGGALQEGEYRTGLQQAGFRDVGVEVLREFSIPDVGTFVSAFVRGTRPAAS
jgi:ubiquinone/menaquinone biosynthesis C-methylase UbiE